jgi:energy-coupling factor transport system substrate-specific component
MKYAAVMRSEMEREKPEYRFLTLMSLAIAMNVVLGALINIIKLPIYLDAVGTILVTLLVGLRAGMVVGAVSFGLMSIFVSPVYVYFIGTQLVISIYTYVAANYFGLFKSKLRVLVAGVGLGVVAATVSAPVIVYVFGGVAGSGRDLITALLIHSGDQVVKAVFLSGAASEPIDKTIQTFLAYSLIRFLPFRLLEQFRNELLEKNGFLGKV